MSTPRLVAVAGPDVGMEFEVPPEGGGIGRGDGNAVRLSDLSVSRSHCVLELKDGALVLVAPGDRTATLVNGRPATTQVLREGDELTVGRTKLVLLPPREGPELMPTSRPSGVTMELATSDLFGRALEGPHGPVSVRDRARLHLAALARLGEGLRGTADRAGIVRAACETLAGALGASRAVLFARDAAGRLVFEGGAGEGLDERIEAPEEALRKVLREGRAVLLEGPGGRPAMASPVPAAPPQREASGLVYVDRAGGSGAPAWAAPDLELTACVAHLTGAALDGALARDALSRDNRALQERLGGAPDFIGETSAAVAVMSSIRKVARADTTVLVLGESGCGKELVASAIHRSSRREKSPLVCVNCAALPESVLESELFGHEKGSFTGATERKIGRFETAHGGTLFLDEVGELSLRSQAKFLRALEDRRFERVGGSRPIAVDVRVVAATNRDLEAMMQKGEFREDLYFRLSVIQILVPPLRERAADVRIISEHLLQRLSLQIGRRVAGITKEAREALSAYEWPGNVRELKNALEYAMVLGEGDMIGIGDLPPHVVSRGARRAASSRPEPASVKEEARSLRELEKDGIRRALSATSGNKVQAAALLEIDRTTLYKKIKEYGLDPKDDG